MARILLIDDEVRLRKTIRLALQSMGHHVVEARHGAEALELIGEAVVDLVLTDLIMPEKDGLETIEVLRRQYPDVKIIAMSGGSVISASDYLKLAEGLGAARVLAKPFSHDELRLAVESVLSPGRAG
jgi:CheY-like chemotaxis protein